MSLLWYNRFLYYIYIYIYNVFIYLFLAALGLCCCAQAFSSCGKRASHCGGSSCCRARALGAWASLVVSHGLSFSTACGIFLGQGSNPYPLHWQEDSFFFFFSNESSNSHDLHGPLFFFFFFLMISLCLFLFILFMAVLGLRFCPRAFSSCGKWGPLFITVRGPLTIAASLVAEHRLQTRRLSNLGSRAQLLHGMWDLPRPGLEPVSSALAGRFSTTAPPGKPGRRIFNHCTTRKAPYTYFYFSFQSCPDSFLPIFYVCHFSKILFIVFLIKKIFFLFLFVSLKALSIMFIHSYYFI